MQQQDLHFVVMLGSLRHGSYSGAIAATLDELAPDTVAVQLLESVGRLPHYSEDLEDAGIPADVMAMGDAVALAEAVIIVTPEYNHSMPGVLKNALDWMSRMPTLPFEQKPVAIQSVSTGRLGGSRAYEHLRQVMVAMDALTLNKPEVHIPHVAGMVDPHKGVVRDEQLRLRIREQLIALTLLANERERSRQKRLHDRGKLGREEL